MWDMLKDYLENNENNSYENVDVISFDENGHMCDVRFESNDEMYEKTLSVSLWDVLAFVHNKTLNN